MADLNATGHGTSPLKRAHKACTESWSRYESLEDRIVTNGAIEQTNVDIDRSLLLRARRQRAAAADRSWTAPRSAGQLKRKGS